MIGVNDKVRKFRRERNISQENLADELGISQSHYSKMERGKVAIKINVLSQIAKILKVDIKELV
ncbi:hypothetical protein CHU92_03765 [Flavobacterium cyanobacteriorum]|uniref:HTH cro/C1-type domain-containing protein n=1 Tax=Flavobacterium cyanobacteriorum TaxID=2022802 RepID=A0A255ZN28_9FLAO|nr:helix-turn-helix transcriptional regulator [Flavobacterium cyanobacteriorum]OYQ42908.1 hypothetical protein CHU92_03765 [Flavobacterium cyanobacteriorum]